jgi:protocatechuate 3,4-dioxygenase beta subunit
MNRRVVALLVGILIVAGLIVWWRWPRASSDVAQAGSGSARSGAIAPGSAATPTHAEAAQAPRAPAPRWSLDVDPEGPLRLEGQVVGPDGKGIGGAEVALGSVPARKVTTDDDGTFVFDKLVSRTYALVAQHDALIGGPVTTKLTDHSDPVLIRLSEGAAVDVSVVDEARQAIASAKIKVLDLGERTMVTDATGHALVAPVRPGWVTVEATAPGYAPNVGVTTVGSAGARGTITVTLKAGVAVAGRVVDEAGKPLAKVRVIARGEEGSTNTDDKGAFTIPALSAGTYTLTALDGEHAPAHSAPVKVAAAAITGVTITMKAGGVATGRVLDAEGKPVPYATVRVGGVGRQFGQVASRQTTSDDKGGYEVRGLARAKMQARAESELAASKLVELDLTAQAAATTDLVLDVTGTIAGTVVDEKGHPITEVTVNAWPDVLAGAPPESAALAGFSSATTDGVGHFVIRGLPGAAYRLWATRATGNPGWGQQSTPARVGEQNVKVTLPSAGSLKGTLAIEGKGAPSLATVQVGFQPPVPVAAGVFELKDLAPGTYDVTFHSLEFAELIRRAVVIKPGAVTDLGTVGVVRGRQISGRVVDARGSAVAGARVKVGEMLFHSEDDEQLDQYDALSNVRVAVTTAAGEFTIVGIPEKAGYVGADHRDKGRSLPVAIAAGVGDPAQVTLTLEAFGSITGKVTKRGQPVAGAMVTESIKGANGQATYAQTHADGTFTMSRVTEGPHALSATERSSMQSKTGAASVTVTAGRTASVTIEIPAGDLALEVTIKPIAGAKLDSAQVFLFPGTINYTTGKELVDGSMQGVGASMKFWFGPDKPQPEFGELVAGAYSLCSIPITGDMNDQTFMQRIQENVPTLRVYCKPVMLQPQPAKQAVLQTLPAMTPLPPPS